MSENELPSVEALNEQHDALMREMLWRENRLLRESLDTLDRWIDPLDAYRGEDGELWNLVGRIGHGATGAAGAGQPSTDRAGFANQAELDRAREICRVLAEVSEFAQNIIENRISYIVGYGHTYTVVAKKGQEAGEKAIMAAQEWLDEWLEKTQWATRQQEIVRRNDRDGETFLRFFPQADGFMQVRFVEPWQVVPPDGNVNDLFGVRTKPEDVESVLGYWIDGEPVDASQIQHRKLNVDLNVRRGVPTLWSIRTLLRRADGIIGKIATKIDIQAAFALIRKHGNATRVQAGAIRDGAVTNRVQDPRTGRTDNYQLMRGGMILDAPAGAEYQFPQMTGGQVADAVEGLQAVLRAIAARVQMPEFMVTADASNANYSSTMVAEGPATKMFERLQHDQIRADLKVIDLAMQFAAESGQLPAGVMDLVEVQASPPQVAVRNRPEETGVREKLHKAGILSKQTWSQEEGYDFEQEQQNLEDAPRDPEPGFDEFGNPKQPQAQKDDPLDEAHRLAWPWKFWEGYPGGTLTENCGTGAGGFKSGNTCAKGSGMSSSHNRDLASVTYRSELPPNVYVHGRSGRQDLDTKRQLFANQDWDTADQYAGRKGSVWVMTVKPEARVFNAADEESRMEVAKKLVSDLEKGRLTPALDEAFAGMSLSDVADSLALDNIVNDGGWYDDLDFAYWAYEFGGIDVVKFDDGIVVLDRESMNFKKVK